MDVDRSEESGEREKDAENECYNQRRHNFDSVIRTSPHLTSIRSPAFIVSSRSRSVPLAWSSTKAIICLHNQTLPGRRLFFRVSQLLNPICPSVPRLVSGRAGWLAGAHLNINVLFFTYNVSHIHTVNTTHNKSV